MSELEARPPARVPEVRTGMPDPKLDEAEFRRRYLSQFTDPAFDALRNDLDAIAAVAWDAYNEGRKAPVTVKAGPEFADPEYDLSVDWLAARNAIRDAEARYADPSGPARILVVNASPRSDHTCPGEISKTWRLAEIAAEVIRAECEVKVLDLSRLTSEYGRNIHPCKACFSTSPALCHWPCSCYPNHALGQTQDWMNDIYPMWAEADGVMILTPVHWYQVSSPLKLMMDRMVCADGGNPDPTATHGKKAALAKKLEMDGWEYPRHLGGRVFSVIVHGDVEGTESVRRSLADWFRFMQWVPAGPLAEVDRYIGYWEPYATGHEALDADLGMQGEVRNAARALCEAVIARRQGHFDMPGKDLKPPREK